MNKAIKTISLVLEITMDIAAVIIGLLTLFSPTIDKYALHDLSLSLSEQLGHIDVDNVINAKGAIFIVLLSCFILILITRQIFRNIRYIFKNSENGTPFQSINVKLIKQIGNLAIAVPIIDSITTLIIHLLQPGFNLKLQFNFTYLLYGLVVLSISKWIEHGVELEKEVEELI